jgi:hypothetical protein
MNAFATVSDLATLWRPLTSDEQTRAEAILPLISDALRQAATDIGKNLDEMIAESATLGSVAKLVTVDVASRVLRQSTEGDAMTQESQSALGYSWSGTYAVPGGGIANAIMYSDLKRLGLMRQRYGSIDLCQKSKGSPSCCM